MISGELGRSDKAHNKQSPRSPDAESKEKKGWNQEPREDTEKWQGIRKKCLGARQKSGYIPSPGKAAPPPESGTLSPVPEYEGEGFALHAASPASIPGTSKGPLSTPRIRIEQQKAPSTIMSDPKQSEEPTPDSARQTSAQESRGGGDDAVP